MTSPVATRPSVVRRLDRRLDDVIFDELAAELEFETTADEAKGRRRFRRWTATELARLPKGHPARALLLSRTRRLRRDLHAGHQTSPTRAGPRKHARFAIHEQVSNIRNQTAPIRIRWLKLTNGVELPIESKDTLPYLIERAEQARDRASAPRRAAWSNLLGRLRAAERSKPRHGKRLRAREGEWFIDLDDRVVRSSSRTSPFSFLSSPSPRTTTTAARRASP